jgi:integrase
MKVFTVPGGRPGLFYHRAYYYNAEGVRKFDSYRCNKKHPKKCNGKYKNDNYCKAYKDAEDRLKSLKHATKTQSLNLESLSKAERVEVSQFAEMAKRVGMPMIQILQIAEQHTGPLKPLDISEGILLFLDAKKAEGCSEGTLKSWRRDLKRISGKFRGQVHELRTDEINKWALALPLAPKSQRHTLGTGGTWWIWMDDLGYSVGPKNPFKKCQRIKSPRKPVVILTVTQARAVINAAVKDPYLAAVVVLVMFCGLRTEEAQKMVWDWIHLEHPMVEVPEGIAKKGEERFNEIQLDRLDLNQKILPPNALAWLQYVEQKQYTMPLVGAANLKGEVLKGGKKRLDGKNKVVKIQRVRKQMGAILPVNPSTYRNRKKKYLKMITGKINVLRHTFCSMHIAAFRDQEATSLLAGNSVRELKASYKRPIPQDNAMEYFNIMPPVETTTKGASKVGYATA